MDFLIQKAFAEIIGNESGVFSIRPPEGIPTDICVVINSVTDFIIAISIPIAGLMILYSAFVILTAAGSTKRFETGKNIILYAILGLVIILLSKGLVFITTELLGVSGSGVCSSSPSTLPQWRDKEWRDNQDRSNPTPPPATLPRCRDNQDNDGDGKIDHPADPDCKTYDDNSEAPDPTSSPTPVDPGSNSFPPLIFD